MKPELSWENRAKEYFNTEHIVYPVPLHQSKLAMFFQSSLKCTLPLNHYYCTWQINPKKITINKFYDPV